VFGSPSSTVFIIAFAIFIGAGVVFISMINVLVNRGGMSERLQTYAYIPDDTSVRDAGRRKNRWTRIRLRINNTLSFFTSEELTLQLLTANWPITESEFLLIRFWSIFGGFLLGWLLFRSPLSGLGLAVFAFIIPGFLLQRAIHNRRLKFERQLVDVLVLLSNSVRAGYSLLQAVDVVVREIQAPASEEFRRVRREVGLGLPLSQALQNLNDRMKNTDLYLVTTAIIINAQVGGNLVTMLEAVTRTIRERVRLFAEVRVLTSQQRFNSYILTLLPFGMGALLFMLNPTYMEGLFEPGIYLCIPIGAFVNVVLGNIIIQRLAKIEV
jgi:tight adherence protein B